MHFSEQDNVDDDATLITIFLVSFNLQSYCLIQSAVCSLWSAVCKCHTPLFHHTAIEHKMNMAQTHYCKFKRTALCENALHYDNKTTINKHILCRFQTIFFQRSKKCYTPFYLQMFCALSGRYLS